MSVNKRRLKPLGFPVVLRHYSPVHTVCVSARQHASSNLHTSNERTLNSTSNNKNGQNVHVAMGLHHQTTSVLNDVIVNDVIDNDVIDSLMNMHKLLASRPNVIATRSV